MFLLWFCSRRRSTIGFRRLSALKMFILLVLGVRKGGGYFGREGGVAGKRRESRQMVKERYPARGGEMKGGLLGLIWFIQSEGLTAEVNGDVLVEGVVL